ncbi:MAG: asparagine synthase family protein [Candidatus Thorarchaeota archaeon]
MAGVAGLITQRREEETSRIMAKMSEALLHRGAENVLTFDLSQNVRGIAAVRLFQDDSVTENQAEDMLQILMGHDCDLREEALGCLEIKAVHKEVVIHRQLFSMTPLYYGRSGPDIAFASERKALWSIGISNPVNLQPGYVLSINENAEWHLSQSDNYERPAMITDCASEDIIRDLAETLRRSFLRVKNRRVGVLFSGGVDSSLVALLAKQVCEDVKLYSASSMAFHDRVAAKTAAEVLDIEMKQVDINSDIVWDVLPNLLFTIESAGLMDVEIALPFYLASRRAASEGIPLMISGQGPDELFAGYSRHVQIFRDEGERALEKQLWSEVSQTHEENIERDDRAISTHGMMSFFPYLAPKFATLALSIPASWKITLGAEPERKVLFRELARHLGLPESICSSPKKATQYSSGSSRILMKSLIQNVNEMQDVTRKKLRFHAQEVLNSVASEIGLPLKTKSK